MNIHRSPALAVSALAAMAATGCAIVGSTRLSPADAATAQGVVYALPLARIPVELYAYEGQLALTMAAPVIGSDPDHVYTLQRHANPFSSDEVTITVDPATGFLSAIDATGKDDTLQILEKLLLQSKGTGKPESAPAEADVIYRASLNPADERELQEAAAAMNAGLREYLAVHGAGCKDGDAVCAEYRTLGLRAPQIRLAGGEKPARLTSPTGPAPGMPAPAATQPASAPAAAPDCGIGVCYRQLRPFQFSASLGERTQAIIVNIPNAAPVLALPIERHAFVSTHHTLSFDNGTLKSAKVERPSSVLALVSSPLAAVSGILNAITEPLSKLLKIDTSGQYEAQAKEEVAKTDAESKAADKVGGSSAPDTGPPQVLATLKLGTRRGSPTAGLAVGPTVGPAVGGGAPSAAAAAPGVAGMPTLPGSDGAGRRATGGRP
jgi:hypothetical protein